ncbi:hemolysin family protein [Tepidimicrobium xylanilyticum]|uniref:Putative hemolysin n=1 Tax=Tepidimicrobium xylanilyticum TaxID=1123352 RepID=A0A1H3B8K0_9FIRM|nr:hemolysin family protein [Tepidimicrobium xylanilyticum]GMG96970.1 hemolysin [Tepidimicrobium xylanilyticum]SDX38233.1 putative hemolysin [Tepidimicrobium xylanilyticum]
MSEGTLWKQLILQIILIFTNAIFACAEIAVLSSNENRLEAMKKEGNKRASRILHLMEEPSRFLSTIQVAITFAGFLASAFAADNFAGRLVDLVIKLELNINVNTLNTISVVIITVILSYFTLVFGELVPKRIAMKNPEKVSLMISGLVLFVAKITSPLVYILTKSTNGVLRLIGIDPSADEEIVTEEDIRMMVDQGRIKGYINPNEHEMINNIFEFDNKYAQDVMTHRTEVSLLWLEESEEDWEKTIHQSRHTYYPVCHESTDNIIGVLNTKDYFRLEDKSRKVVLEKAVRPPYFVPETVRTDILFHNMKKSRNHFAVVLDDYGGMTGIITINDLLEQLVGNLDDDDTIPVEPPLIERIDSRTWKIQGNTPVELVAEQLEVALPDIEEYDTFGGFVFGLLGTIPVDGSTPELDVANLHIKVISIKDHRMERAVVYVEPKEENKDNNGSE